MQQLEMLKKCNGSDTQSIVIYNLRRQERPRSDYQSVAEDCLHD